MGNLRLWFNPLLSFVGAKGASFKAAKVSIDVTKTSEPNDRKPFRKSVWRVKRPNLNPTKNNRLNDRRTWVRITVALLGAFIIFLAGVGVHHLFLPAPDSVTVAEAETSQENEKSLLTSVEPQASIVNLPSNDASETANTPKSLATNQQLLEPEIIEITNREIVISLGCV